MFIKFLDRDYSLMNFAHSSSPKSVLEWVLLAEQILICHFDLKRLVRFKKKTPKSTRLLSDSFFIIFIVYKLQQLSPAIDISLQDPYVLLKTLALHFKLL